MSAVMDTYEIALRHGWKFARPWPDNDTDVYRRGDVLIVVCWDRNETAISAYAVSMVGTGTLREFPNPGDADGLIAVQRWLSEVTP